MVQFKAALGTYLKHAHLSPIDKFIMFNLLAPELFFLNFGTPCI